MFQSLRAGARAVASLPKRAWRRKWLTLALTVTVLTLAVLGGIWYVWGQWRSAQAALTADRPEEARSRLAVCLLVWPRDPEVHLLAARAARLSGH